MPKVGKTRPLPRFHASRQHGRVRHIRSPIAVVRRAAQGRAFGGRARLDGAASSTGGSHSSPSRSRVAPQSPGGESGVGVMPDTLEPPVATGFRPGGTLLSATISNSIVGHEDGRDHNATMTAPDGSALFVACRARVEVLLDGRAGMDVVGRARSRRSHWPARSSACCGCGRGRDWLPIAAMPRTA